MKTLSEVIKALEICDETVTANCPNCPYDLDCENVPGEDLRADALHYLKAFRDAKDALDAEREKTIEAYCQWKDAREKLEAQTSQMMWVDKHFQFEISDNPPLDWETLKQMEGNPVWVEYNRHLNSKEWRDHSKCWDIINHFGTFRNNPEEIMFTEKGFVFGKKGLGLTWQAYQKEKK